LKPLSVYLLSAAMGLATVAACWFSPAIEAAQDTAAAQAPYVPKNLKVLPRDLTSSQLHDVMEGWADEIGGDCSTCHVRNPSDVGPNGKPRFDFADDSKEEKKTARVMYTMLENINGDVGRVPNSGMPVTCGTCHRGHLSPPPFSDSESGEPQKTAQK